MQILSACRHLEDLTLCNCVASEPDAWKQHTSVHPFMDAVADVLMRSAAQMQGLRSLHLHWDASQQYAWIDRCVFCELAAVPSITVYAASVVLCVPYHRAQVPAALKIVTQRLRLTGCKSVAELEVAMASFRSRCQLVVEGVDLDSVISNYVPPRSYDGVLSAYHVFNEQDPDSVGLLGQG